jgi:hypothetical protein
MGRIRTREFRRELIVEKTGLPANKAGSPFSNSVRTGVADNLNLNPPDYFDNPY